MRILLTSDTHLGITTEGQIKAMLREASKIDFDVLVHCGDWSGGSIGHKAIKRTLTMMRKQFPDKPMVATVGNHDYWCQSSKRVREISPWGEPRYVTRKPSPADFDDNLVKIKAEFQKHNVHFVDKDGVYKHPNFPNVYLLGSSGWYNSPNPPTRDSEFLPIGYEGDTNRFILRQTERDLFDNVDAGLQDFDKTTDTLVFISHFPVINAGPDYKGNFHDFSWAEHIGAHFIEEYGCKHFLCGHAHQKHEGPLRYESGPDYYNPKFLLIEV